MHANFDTDSEERDRRLVTLADNAITLQYC